WWRGSCPTFPPPRRSSSLSTPPPPAVHAALAKVMRARRTLPNLPPRAALLPCALAWHVRDLPRRRCPVTDPAYLAELIERCVTRFAAGLRTADDLTFTHEAERLEALPTSPVVTRMREIVAAELDRRHDPQLPAPAVPAVT